MKIKKLVLLWFAPLLVCVMLPGFVRADSFLTNPGFEAGSFSGWTVSGPSPNFGVATAGTVITGIDSVFGTTTVLVNSGTYAGYAVVCTGGCFPSGHPIDYLDLSQQISVVAGAAYATGFWVAANAPFAFNDSVEIFVDGTPITLTSRPTNVISSYQFVGGTFTTSDVNPTITYQIGGSGFGDAGFSFDDFSVTGPSPVPEPSSLLLLGTSLLGLMRLRGKRLA